MTSTTLATITDTRKDKQKQTYRRARRWEWGPGMYNLWRGSYEKFGGRSKKIQNEYNRTAGTHVKETQIIELEEYVFFTSRGTTRSYGVEFLISKPLRDKV